MNITKILRYAFVGQLLIAALIAIAGEAEWLPIGALSDDGQRTYVLSIIGVALAIIGIPLAMKLMHLHYVRKHIWPEQENASTTRDELNDNTSSSWQPRYSTWSHVRMGLLWLSLLYNLLMYYLLDYNTTCGYLALMTVVAYVFIWPSDERMQAERTWERKQI